MEEDDDQRGKAISDANLVQELMMHIAEAEARATAVVENERIAELKIKTLPEYKVASVLTAQEITDEELDKARGVPIEVNPGVLISLELLRRVLSKRQALYRNLQLKE